MAYPFKDIEARWQTFWEENKTFATPAKPDLDREKMYILDMFPYPSGDGLHVGHPEGYTATDIMARYKRMCGVQVLHPMGWDSFGLPAEQHAIKTGVHPSIQTRKNIDTFRAQLKMLGFSYDWDREIATSHPNYYKWTQWIFLKLHERGLAYVSEQPVNWCPELGTVLANEEVIDGKSEVGGHPVVRRPMKQWMLKITEYADKLLEGLDDLDWPESTKKLQRDWIGRSEGAEVDFAVSGHEGETVRVYTTRPDTLFGATYMVLAPEHALVEKIMSADQTAEVQAYVEAASRKSERDRTASREKTGVFIGAMAVNPVNGAEIPIWISDYVLATYGTGAIMAVPAHDERDYEFATAFELPIVEVISGGNIAEAAWTGDGELVNSANDDVSLNGLLVDDSKAKIIDWLEAKGQGTRTVNTKLRDWLFSRQRYWGEPFPIAYVNDEPHPLSVDDLPIVAPPLESYESEGTTEGPLANAVDWCQTELNGQPARRETNTMPQWAGSCWYYLRFIDPRNEEALIDPDLEKFWMPVDLYIGGAEHANLHLLYARFWHKVLYDAGVVSTSEPFRKLFHQGMITGPTEFTLFRDANGHAINPPSKGSAAEDEASSEKLDAEAVVKKGDGFVWKEDPAIKILSRAYKMSKSRGNVVNPNDIVEKYGADSLRLYEMFMGPLEQVKPWNTDGVQGVYKFLDRTWRWITDDDGNAVVVDRELSADELTILHQTIKRVTESIDSLRLNTGIAAMMEFLNAATKWADVPREAAECLTLILSPFAPHLSEELWRKMGHSESSAYVSWPVFDEKFLQKSEFECVVQVNGKLKARLMMSVEAGKDEVLALVKAEPTIAALLEGKTIRKEIVVPGRLVNLVVS